MEIERKWLIDDNTQIPNIEKMEWVFISQGIFVSNDNIEGRVRCTSDFGNDEEWCIIMKDGESKLSRNEYHSIIDRDYGEWLCLKCPKILTKLRGICDIDGTDLKCEVNLISTTQTFKHDDKYLIMVEIEFPSEDDAKNFEAPSWFGKEVTDDKNYYNKKLTEQYGL